MAASLDITFSVTNKELLDQITATNIKISIPTPEGTEFDTVISGYGYSDVLKNWTIDNIPPGQTTSLILRYTVLSGSSWDVSGQITGCDQVNVASVGNYKSAVLIAS